MKIENFKSDKDLIDFLNKNNVQKLNKFEIDFLFSNATVIKTCYLILVEYTVTKKTIFYSELINKLNEKGINLNLPNVGKYMATVINAILNVITLHMFYNRKPLISIIVLNKGTKLPSNNFFKLITDLKIFNRKYISEREFYKQELKEVFKYFN